MAMVGRRGFVVLGLLAASHAGASGAARAQGKAEAVAAPTGRATDVAIATGGGTPDGPTGLLDEAISSELTSNEKGSLTTTATLVLSQVWGTPISEWEGTYLVNDGGYLTVTPEGEGVMWARALGFLFGVSVDPPASPSPGGWLVAAPPVSPQLTPAQAQAVEDFVASTIGFLEQVQQVEDVRTALLSRVGSLATPTASGAAPVARTPAQFQVVAQQTQASATHASGVDVLVVDNTMEDPASYETPVCGAYEPSTMMYCFHYYDMYPGDPAHVHKMASAYGAAPQRLCEQCLVGNTMEGVLVPSTLGPNVLKCQGGLDMAACVGTGFGVVVDPGHCQDIKEACGIP